MTQSIIAVVYVALLAMLTIHSLYRFWLVLLFLIRRRAIEVDPKIAPQQVPFVLVQLPVYNERAVAARVITAAARLDWPEGRLEIQVLDDSTDNTREVVERCVSFLRANGRRVELIRRDNRKGFKAGALREGLKYAHHKPDLIAVFDADFVPQEDFLKRVQHHFIDPRVAMVQARWDFSNRECSLLTKLQGLMLDAHFVIDHGGRFAAGYPFRFNGSGGVWRREAIEEVGNWADDTLTEDLDLSYRVQLERRWRFVYRNDIAVMSDLPTSLLAFASQQFRWAKGSMQVARKLLGRIWQSQELKLAQKVSATFDMFSNGAYLLLLGVAILMPQVYELRANEGFDWVRGHELICLSIGTLSMVSYFGTAQWALGRSIITAIASLVPLMALGMGMAVNAGIAFTSGLSRRQITFERTPKSREYRAPLQPSVFVIQCVMVGWLSAAIAGWTVTGVARPLLLNGLLERPFLWIVFFGYFGVTVGMGLHWCVNLLTPFSSERTQAELISASTSQTDLSFGDSRGQVAETRQSTSAESDGGEHMKDGWEKLKILSTAVGTILVPLAIVLVPFVITDRLTITARDIDLMTRFHEIYNQGNKRLSIHFVRRVDDPRIRFDLRKFIVWDALESKVGGAEVFKFDSEDQRWHLLGDVLLDMKESATTPSEVRETVEWWECSVKSHSIKSRWIRDAAELQRLFQWVETTYGIDTTAAHFSCR